MTANAVIFDLDDTLVATASLWKQAESQLLASIGQKWDASLAARHKGMNALDVAAVIHDHYQPSISRIEAQQLMREALIERFLSSTPVPMCGAVECVRRAAARYRIGVASGSPPPAIDAALDGLGILSLFSQVVSSESVSRGKPAPDVYLAAAKAMGVKASECVAVEDSLIGAIAAREAGMRCFLIPSNPDALKADWSGVRLFQSLDQLFVDRPMGPV